MRREANRGTTMDVGGWLRKLDLERYEAAFRENEINGRVPPDLTQGDFIGHRRMLLEAIAALRAATTDTAPSGGS
jgi:hypothetical protein